MTKQKGQITVGERATEWFHSHAEGQLAQSTESGYRDLIFNHIVPKLGDITLGKLTDKRVKTFYTDLFNGELSDGSVRCVHLLLRRVLDKACRAGLLSANPAAKIQMTSATDHESMRLRPARTKQNYREHLPQCREKKPVSTTPELVVTEQQKAADKMASLLSL